MRQMLINEFFKQIFEDFGIDRHVQSAANRRINLASS